jgi:hypothetical protein
LNSFFNHRCHGPPIEVSQAEINARNRRSRKVNNSDRLQPDKTIEFERNCEIPLQAAIDNLLQISGDVVYSLPHHHRELSDICTAAIARENLSYIKLDFRLS